MNIPFLDLRLEYNSVRPDIDFAIKEVLDSFQFIGGEKVRQFERAFCQTLGTRHCIATGNGTDSLFSILKMLDLKSGDEVITPAWSWISSAETISLCGATPVFVDVEDATYTINPEKISQAITKKTRAVIVVHLYGQAAELNSIRQLCIDNKLYLIEDCAQAHLTEYQGRYVGTFGTASAFSFYPTKNLGAYGDAGCVVTNDDELSEMIRRFANHGALSKDDHLIEGMNSRMDNLQAAILLAKLRHLVLRNEKRRENAQLYQRLLHDMPSVKCPAIRPATTHTFHIFAIRAQRRLELQKFLASHGVTTLIHYPVALCNLPVYARQKQSSADFAVSISLQEEQLSLPIYPELTSDQIIYITEKIKAFYRKGA